MKLLHAVWSLPLALACGCSSQESDATSGGQVKLTRQGRSSYEQMMVYVIDDSPKAADLRHALGRGFLDYDADFGHVLKDPAAWVPVDRELVIARPSRAFADRLSTSVGDARLHWVSPHITTEEALQFHAGMVAAIEESVTPEGGPLTLLDTWARLSDVINGRVAPITDDERHVAAFVKNDRSQLIVLYLLAAGDDMSGLPAAAYQRNTSITNINPLVLWDPAVDRTSGCRGSLPPRLGEWFSRSQRLEVWPCEEDSWVFPWGAIDARTACLPNKVSILDGSAQCRVMSEAIDACPEAQGWANPLGADGVRRPRAGGSRSDAAPRENGRSCETCSSKGALLKAVVMTSTVMIAHRVGVGPKFPSWCNAAPREAW